MALSRKVAATVMTMIVTFAFTQEADADGLQWGGVQLQGGLAAELKLDEGVGMRGQTMMFLAPTLDTYALFFYIGPSFRMAVGEGHELWISPQLVGTVGWFSGQPGIGPSVMAEMSLFRKRMTVAAEVDLLIGAMHGDVDFYGYYIAAGHLDENWSFGGQVEQVNLHFMAGPHVGWKEDVFRVQVQYFLGTDIHALRLVAMVEF